MPGGVPRWIRCYDNGGTSADRYTVIFGGRHGQTEPDGSQPALAMSAEPCHPQGVGMHVSCRDSNGWGFTPKLGRTCHLGKRIPFAQLPADCRRLVLIDYKELWKL